MTFTAPVRRSVVAEDPGGPPEPAPNTTLFWDDYAVSAVSEQVLSARTPSGIYVVGGHYVQHPVGVGENVGAPGVNIRPAAGIANLEYANNEPIPEPGLAWGTHYHRVRTEAARLNTANGAAGIAVRSSNTSSPNLNRPVEMDGILLWVGYTSSRTRAYARVRNGGTDSWAFRELWSAAGIVDVDLRIESELVGDNVHFALLVNNVLQATDTALFDVAKNNTKVSIYNRRDTTDAWASRLRYVFQVDTFRVALP